MEGAFFLRQKTGKSCEQRWGRQKTPSSSEFTKSLFFEIFNRIICVKVLDALNMAFKEHDKTHHEQAS